MKEYKGRVIVKGEAEGEVLATRHGFNILSSYLQMVSTNTPPAICSDQNNPELYQKNLTGAILCVPQVIGSTSAGLVLQAVASLDAHPRAILFSKPADSLAVAGLLLSEIWEDKRIIAIDSLGDEFIDSVKSGMTVSIREDGTVQVYN